MSDKPASLLTKTQRDRLATDFSDVDSAKRRRDQRQIRERLAAGLTDFSVLADYPDDQIETAVADLSDDELAEALADVHVFAERVRDIRGIEPATVDERTPEAPLADNVPERSVGDTAPHDDATPWRRRAELLLNLGTFLLVPALTLTTVAHGVTTTVLGRGLLFLLLLFGVPSLLAGLTIVAARGLKYDLVPVIEGLRSDPIETVRSGWSQL